jgi:putative transposase
MFAAKLSNEAEKSNQKVAGGRLDELISRYEDPIKALVHRTLEEYVEKAFAEFMGERIGTVLPRESDGRPVRDYRNGSRTVKQVMIDTLALQDFRVPRNRAGGFHPAHILQRSRRIAGRFAELALNLYVNGVSTRKVRRSFERTGITISGLSKSTVSEISKDLLKEYLAWINRPIVGRYKYLQADGVHVTVRKSRGYKQCVMIVIGIREDGHKEVLYFTLGSESTRNFEEVLQNMVRRGLDLSTVELVTIDGARGPINAVERHFGRDRLQRCVVHKTRNVLDKAPKVLKDEIKAKLCRLWYQSSRLEAQEYARRLREEYQAMAPKAMDCLFEDMDDLLRFYELPEPHRKTISNTNLIERVMREVRRRVKVMDSIDGENGLYAITMGTIREQNERWSHKSHWKKS